MDAKRKYTRLVEKVKNDLDQNAIIEKKIRERNRSQEKYKDLWEKVNLDEIVKKFAPGSEPIINENGKIIFRTPGSNIQVVAEATAPKKVTKKTTNVEVEVVEAPATSCNCQGVVDATLAYAKELTEAGFLTEEHYNGFVAIANGEEAPKVTHNGYTDSDIDKMYGDWMK